MAPHETEAAEKLARINRVYFSDPTKRIRVRAGEIISLEGEENFRLYLIIEGEVVAYRRNDVEGKSPLEGTPQETGHEIFRAGKDFYIGVLSFFSRRYRMSSSIVAETSCELAYIDNTVEAVEEEKYGSLVEQFVPAMLHELSLRADRVFERTVEKEALVQRMHRSEMSATLGQLAAGIAHELNNAVGVLARKTDFITEFLSSDISARSKEASELFQKGLEYVGIFSSDELRKVSRELERAYDLEPEVAKVLARVAGSVEGAKALGGKFISRLGENVAFWELGHDLHDMRVAAKHASSIVRSVKLLGGGNNISRDPGLSVHESLCEAVALLKSNLREIKLVADIGNAEDCPQISADMTEMVQIWVNIIKNACDALKLAGTPEPTIRLKLRAVPSGTLSGFISVEIEDNGPGIPKSAQQKIYQPDYTTKKNGLQFGLGLGLAIVKRLIDSYGAEISLSSVPGQTRFTVHIPYKKM
ncbi:MAG: ATP-binding protein [Bacteroidales bacterium]|nr:ATP-binding protein [Bacteroidales bacterium]